MPAYLNRFTKEKPKARNPPPSQGVGWLLVWRICCRPDKAEPASEEHRGAAAAVADVAGAALVGTRGFGTGFRRFWIVRVIVLMHLASLFER